MFLCTKEHKTVNRLRTSTALERQPWPCHTSPQVEAQVSGVVSQSEACIATVQHPVVVMSVETLNPKP